MAHPQQFLVSSSPYLFWISRFGYTNYDRALNGAYHDGYYYSTGSVDPGAGTGEDSFVIKYNEYGQVIWEKYLNVGSNQYGRGISVDSSGNIYVNLTEQGFQKPMWTIKLNSEGVIQWQRQISTGYWTNQPLDLQCDSSGNVYWCGYVNIDAYYGNDRPYIVKYDSDGNLEWTKLAGTNQNARCVSIDKNNGDVYSTYGNKVSHFNSSGTLQRTLEFSGLDSQNGVICSHIDDSGNIYIAGQDSTSSRNVYTIKMNSSGTIQWQAKSSMTQTGFTGPTGIGIDDNGDVYISGNFYINSPVTNVLGFIFKYNGSNGNIIWQRTLDSPNIIFFQSRHLFITENNVYVTGQVASSLSDNTDNLVAKLPADGSLTGTYGSFTWQAASVTNSTPSVTISTPTISFGTLGSSSTSSLSITNASTTKSIVYLI